MISAIIVGGTGYTGSELTRLLLAHPAVDVKAVVSHSKAGESIATYLALDTDMVFSEQIGNLKGVDIVFFATPNGVAMTQVPEILDAGVRVIDLAADFRLMSPEQWEQWYGMKHQCPELLDTAIYGLPECYREQIKQARLIANPGCYPTSVILGFKPLLDAKLADINCLIADSKSGVSGAGRSKDVSLSYGECSENFRAYKVAAHRHFPEIKNQLDCLADSDTKLSFTPHLLPIIRGIHSTLYVKTKAAADELQSCFEQAYAIEPFVKVLPPGTCPETRQVRGTNYCLVAVHKPADSDFAKVLVVIDNLGKGAASQAVQNMNLMFSLDERSGLDAVPILP